MTIYFQLTCKAKYSEAKSWARFCVKNLKSTFHIELTDAVSRRKREERGKELLCTSAPFIGFTKVSEMSILTGRREGEKRVAKTP